MLAIKTEGLIKEFSGIKAVDNVCLHVPEGSVYGFLGPNGAGKTTTIKMLTGMLKPSSGTIEIFGEKAVYGKPYGNNCIGFLPDVPDFYGWMKGDEFLLLCGRLVGMKDSEIRLQSKEILKRVGLDHVNKKIKGYSRGMKQRLGIAQALLHKPRIVFMDEPTSALDPMGRKEILELILDLRKEMTVFLSTHILTDVERVCDRVAVLNKGKILVEDEITHLKDLFSNNLVQLDVMPGFLEKAVNSIKKLPCVDDIQTRDNNILELKMKVNEENNIKLLSALGHDGIAITAMTTNNAGLEDIFVKVVNQK
jgi:ABC-2 type transport system ATP-binding protein